MNTFDDFQIEEVDGFDFSEAYRDGLFEEEDDDKTFQQLLNSNYDY